MNFDALARYLDHLTSWRIPGNGIQVCIEGKEVFSYNSGYADVENQIPMTNDHYINIYSCSKVATVTAALQLYEQGKFLLDDPLYEFIPEYKDMYIKDQEGNIRPAKNPITLRHLFTMTAGMTYDRETAAYDQARQITNGRMDTQTVIRTIAQDPLIFEPGSSWNYSVCHDVLAAVVEIISGKRFSEYVRENIFDPLDMKKSMHHNDAVQDQMACLYEYIDGSKVSHVQQQAGQGNNADGYAIAVSKKVNGVFGPDFDSGGSGVTTTINDYAKFCVALANGGIGATGEKILSAGTIDLLRTNQLTPEQQVQFKWPQMKGYGYGLGVRTLIDKAAGSVGNLGEFGWGGAGGATVLVDPSLKLSVFYAHHMLNPQEPYYQPRLRNVIYGCIL